MAKTYTVFKTPQCIWCLRVLDLIEAKDPEATVQIRDLTKDDEALRRAQEMSFKTVPQVYVDDRHIGGFDATQAYFEELENV